VAGTTPSKVAMGRATDGVTGAAPWSPYWTERAPSSRREATAAPTACPLPAAVPRSWTGVPGGGPPSARPAVNQDRSAESGNRPGGKPAYRGRWHRRHERQRQDCRERGQPADPPETSIDQMLHPHCSAPFPRCRPSTSVSTDGCGADTTDGLRFSRPTPASSAGPRRGRRTRALTRAQARALVPGRRGSGRSRQIAGSGTGPGAWPSRVRRVRFGPPGPPGPLGRPPARVASRQLRLAARAWPTACADPFGDRRSAQASRHDFGPHRCSRSNCQRIADGRSTRRASLQDWPSASRMRNGHDRPFHCSRGTTGSEPSPMMISRR